MPHFRAWLFCIIIIPTFITVFALNNPFQNSSWIVSLRKETLTMHLHGVFLNRYPATGRYIDVRRHFGLEERLVFAARSSFVVGSFSSQPPVQIGTTEPQKELTGKIKSLPIPQFRRTPRLRRAQELILDELHELPNKSDATKPHSRPLKLTEDSSWDYSNSKREILDAFARSAQRDSEEELAETITKQAKVQAREKKLKKLSTKRPKVCRRYRSLFYVLLANWDRRGTALIPSPKSFSGREIG
ncbi:hypothetical protein FS842_007474 [Serendipita sp. 407]|nr:hypothetical protein FS842_007474 [Serendipita sp. 407]